MSVTPRINQREHRALIEDGYQANVEGSFYRHGRVYDKIKYKKNVELNLLEKVGRVALLCISVLPCCIPICCCSSFFDREVGVVFTGTYEKEGFVYNEQKSSVFEKKLPERMGFNPKDRATIVSHLQKPENKCRLTEWEGHYYLPLFEKTSGFSYILFVPFKDFKDSACINLWDNKTGNPMANSSQLIAMAKKYCATYVPNNKKNPLNGSNITIINTKTAQNYGSIVEVVSAREGVLLN